MKRPPIRDHRNQGREGPWRPFRGRGDQHKTSPEENKHAYRHADSFCHSPRENPSEAAKHEIEQDVIPLPSNPKPRQLPTFHKLRQPGVVQMAAQVPCSNLLVPEGRDEHSDRCPNECKPSLSRYFERAPEGRRALLRLQRVSLVNWKMGCAASLHRVVLGVVLGQGLHCAAASVASD